ncbi:hypothetical protein JAAARDRAFT_47014 [Jaapia argillacea MUCL 33604]|uniref:GPI transamidase component PIG-S n=1 Tax=Jaapia argillacea MUCL 33604 TaxID=933084 RepID=A0A067Q7M4_9AGAM|nr:hypothetical protein JAAARDRAFT_47014 [Jaapia argillacea MUCL 33604]
MPSSSPSSGASSAPPIVSALPFESAAVRRSILAAYWLVIIFALPLWWSSTSIERLSLPNSRVWSETTRTLQFPLHVVVNEGGGASGRHDLDRQLTERRRHDPEAWQGLQLHVNTGETHIPPGGPVAYEVDIGPRHGSSILDSRRLSCEESEVADILNSLLAPYGKGADRGDYRVAKYSPRYRLTFTLLNEDSAAGAAATGWGIEDALDRHITPVLSRLSDLHNFTVESQVQFHAPLAFKPVPVVIDGKEEYGLTQEDLTVFVNSAEWTLSSSVSNDPVLHFVLFVPSAARRPLHILNSEGWGQHGLRNLSDNLFLEGLPSTSDAFILPQWGGIVIYNPPSHIQDHAHLSPSHLERSFNVFLRQLLALLGVPPLPPGVSSSEISLTTWQLDALLRRRSVENVAGCQETLQSIVKLVDQIPNMPVGQDVRGDILQALSELEQTYDAAKTSPQLALVHSSRASTLASRAFFNPGMLALLYFPPEHRYAVYTPLFASATVPLIAAVIREVLAWRRQRKGKEGLENDPGLPGKKKTE